MKFRASVALIVFCAASAHAQTVTITAAHLGGSDPVTGVITFQPVLADGTTAASTHLSGGGLTNRQPKTATVTAGAFSLPNMPDTSTTNPANLCYAVTVKSHAGLQTLGPGFSCVQPAANNSWCTSGACNFDNYVPDLAPLVPVTSGPPGAAGPPLNYRGTWSSATSYAIGDTVTYSGSIYVAKAAQSNNEPDTSPSDWDVFGVTSNSSNPQLCAVSTGTSICAGTGPYIVSGAGTTTTTTASAYSSGVTAITVGSCSSFLAGQGIRIQGADPTTITSCSGTALAVSPGLSAGVSSGASVFHDNTAALQAAVAALGAAGGGDLYLPCGIFLASGPLQDTGGANAVIQTPKILSPGGLETVINIHGCQTSVGGSNPIYGTVIQTAITTGNLIGGYNAASTSFGPFTNVKLGLYNLTFRAPDSTGAEMVNAHWINAIDWKHLRCDSVTDADSTNSAGVCLEAPSLSSDVGIQLDDLYSLGFYTNWILGEHAHAGNLYAGGGHNCLVPDVRSGSHPGVGNMVKVDYFWHQLCVNAVHAGSSQTTVDITMDSEVATAYDVDDAGGLLTGTIKARVPYADGRSPSTPTSLTVNGAANLNVCNLTTSTCTKGSSVSAPTVSSSCTATASVFVTVSGVLLQIPTCVAGLPASLETWNANAGSGSTFTNTGTDSSNAATASGVTWSGADAQFNGTSSYAVASSGADTNFSGTTPFSISAWINSSAQTGTIVGTYDSAASSLLGWNLGIAGDGTGMYALSLAIVHDVTVPSYLLVAGTALAVNTTHHVCVTYSGSQHASGVHFYVDGASSGTTGVEDTLTASSASTAAPVIGANTHSSTHDGFFQGSIGYVHIFPTELSAGGCAAIYAAGKTAY